MDDQKRHRRTQSDVLSLSSIADGSIFLASYFHIGHLFFILISIENRYKSEAIVDGEAVLFEILDTCPKVREEDTHFIFYFLF